MDHPSTDGVIRVDNYWCHSAILSTRPKELSSIIPSSSNGIKNSEVQGEGSPLPPQDGVGGAGVDNGLNGPGFESPSTMSVSPPLEPANSGSNSNSHSSSSTRTPGKRENMMKKFDPRARLSEMKRNAEMKGGPAFAAKLRSKARAAMLASREKFNLLQLKNKENQNSKNNIAGEGNDGRDGDVRTSDEAVRATKVLAVDLPGMSFITLFCDDQKVPLPSTIVDILSKQVINRTLSTSIN